jgi:hypothetical protein
MMKDSPNIHWKSTKLADIDWILTRMTAGRETELTFALVSHRISSRLPPESAPCSRVLEEAIALRLLHSIRSIYPVLVLIELSHTVIIMMTIARGPLAARARSA